MRCAGAMLQRRGAEEERRIDLSPERPLGTDAHMRPAGGMFQRCYRAVTGISVLAPTRIRAGLGDL